LRDDVNRFSFSPDGKYIMAQDDASIYVLSHDPSSTFSGSMPETWNGPIHADSKGVVFHNSELRVEAWDIEKHKRRSVNELTRAQVVL